eukprot:1430849-Pyramimonas_sp.AAC.1
MHYDISGLRPNVAASGTTPALRKSGPGVKRSPGSSSPVSSLLGPSTDPGLSARFRRKSWLWGTPW